MILFYMIQLPLAKISFPQNTLLLGSIEILLQEILVSVTRWIIIMWSRLVYIHMAGWPEEPIVSTMWSLFRRSQELPDANAQKNP